MDRMERAMKISCLSVALVWLAVLFTVSGVYADSIADDKERPISLQEEKFIEDTVNELRTLFPPPGEGWEMKESVYIGQHIYRGDKGGGLIYESMDKVTLPVSIRFDYHRLTQKETVDKKKTAQHTADMNSLQEEMMKAIQSGDAQEIERVSQKMAALQRGEYTDRMSPMVNPQAGGAEKEKAKTFYVHVLVNKGGETIGKKYESSESGATRAFVVKKKKSPNMTSYKYYFGPWKVKDHLKNVTISFPDTMDTAANHLRVVTLMVTIAGDTEEVDDYVKRHVNSVQVNSLVN